MCSDIMDVNIPNDNIHYTDDDENDETIIDVEFDNDQCEKIFYIAKNLNN